jgi:hypothetical protein
MKQQHRHLREKEEKNNKQQYHLQHRCWNNNNKDSRASN